MACVTSERPAIVPVLLSRPSLHLLPTLCVQTSCSNVIFLDDRCDTVYCGTHAIPRHANLFCEGFCRLH